MTAIPFPGWQTSANGTTLASGAKIYFWVPGTSTARTPFSDTALTVPTTNPVILNSSGWPSTNIYLDSALAYEYEVKSSDDATTYVDRTLIPSAVAGSQPVDATLTALAGLTIADGDFIQGTGADSFRTRKVTVATYAALTSIAAASRFDDMLVYVASRATDGDGGEGWWRFDAASSATANGGTILAPDAGTGRWLRQYAGNVSVKWFGAVPGGAAAANTTAIQAAIDLVFAQTGGGVVEIIGNYNINAALSIGAYVELQGPGRLTQTTSNTQIIIVNKGTFQQGWAVRNLDLYYQSLQPASNTSANALVVCDANKFSWSFVVEDVFIYGAATGILAPELTASFAFLATFNNVVIEQCSSYGFDWLNASTGASTFLSMNNVWVQNISGAEIAGSKGFRIKRCVSLSINSIAADHIQDAPVVFFESCYGKVGTIAIESCDVTKSVSGEAYLLAVSGGSVDIAEVNIDANNVVIGGSAVAAAVRVSDSAVCQIGILRDNANTVVDTSSDAWYTVNPTSNVIVTVNDYFYAAAGSNPVPNGNLADSTQPFRIKVFDNNVRRDVRGGKEHIFTTAVPASGTWAVGDTAWNTDPTTSIEPIGWICTTAGTPGTWFPFGAPTTREAAAADIAAIGNAVNTAGKFAGLLVWDTTNNRMMRARGSAAADPWDVVDGSASVTPS